jgi:histidinol phosphatase-like enzyme
MEKTLILEISRIQELMGVYNDQLLIENPIKLILQNLDAFKVADVIFKSAADAKAYVKSINDLVKDDNLKLTDGEIDIMGEHLFNHKDLIANAAKKQGDGILEIPKGATPEIDAVIIKQQKGVANVGISSIDFQNILNKKILDAFENTDLKMNKFQRQSSDRFLSKLYDEMTDNTFSKPTDDYFTIDGIKARYLERLETAMDATGTKPPKNFYEWALGKFGTDLADFIDGVGPRYEPGGTHAGKQPLENPNQPAIQGEPVSSTMNPSWLKSFIQAIIDFFKKRGLKLKIERLTDDIERLKVTPATVGDNINPNFTNLVKKIKKDIDMVVGQEGRGSIFEEWNKMLDQLPSDLQKQVKEVKLYGDGIFYKDESVDEFLEALRLKGVDGNTINDVKTFYKKVKEWLSLAKKLISGAWSGLPKLIAKKLNLRTLLNVIIFKSFKSPKQWGYMLSKRGFTLKGFFISFIEAYFTLLIWKKLGVLVWAIGWATKEFLWSKVTGQGLEEKKTMFDLYTEKVQEEWTDFTNPNFWDPVNGIQIFNNTISVITYPFTEETKKYTEELEKSKEKAFNDYWDLLPKDEQKAAIDVQAGPALLPGAGGFPALYYSTLVTDNLKPQNVLTRRFMEEKNLDITTIKKIADSLVTYKSIDVEIPDKEEVKNLIDSTKIKNTIKNTNKANEAIENSTKNQIINTTFGAVRDKDKKLYQIDGKPFNFTFSLVPYKPYYKEHKLAAVDEYKIYYAKDTYTTPKFISKNEYEKLIDKEAIKNLLEDDEIYSVLIAKTIVAYLNSKTKIVNSPPIQLNDMINKL